MEKLKLKYNQLTVAQLIEKLKQMPQDAPVCHEGCDCYGDADNVVLSDNGMVLITRL